MSNEVKEISNLMKRRIKDYIEEGKRFDSRELLDYRDIEIETAVSKNAEGSARVRLGKTDVIAGVKLGVNEPYPDSEDAGTLVTTMELLPLSSEEFNYGPPGIEAIEIARIVDRGIRESGFIDFKKLCIKKGEKVWSVFIDIYSINDDGNLLDASCLASVAALLTATMPKYDEKEEKILYDEKTNKKLPLTKNIPLTFTFHKIGKRIILDPGAEEEKSSESKLSMALSYNSKKEIIINAVQKGNEVALSEKETEEMLDLGEKKFKELYEEVMDKIEKNLKEKSK